MHWHALTWHWLTTGVALACPGEPPAAGDGAERRSVTSQGYNYYQKGANNSIIRHVTVINH